MTTSDIRLTIFIIFLFSVLHTFSKITLELNNVKNNWSIYRCKPAIMIFAEAYGHDAYENFTYCIQNIQSTFVENDLKDVNQSNDLIDKNMHSTTDALDTTDEANTRTSNENKKTTNFSTGLISKFTVGIKRFMNSLTNMADNVKANTTLNSSSANNSMNIFGESRDESKKEVDKMP